jgi:amino acid transporter
MARCDRIGGSDVMTDLRDQDLKPELGLLDATMINVGTMIASAIYLVPATIAAQFSGVAPTMMVWIVGGVVSLFGALSMAELGAAMPRAGGMFVYLSRAFGPTWGYLYGWGAAVIINPASIAAIAVGFATYLDYFTTRAGLPLGAAGIKTAAILSIAALTFLNCFGLKLGAVTQNVLTLIKIAAAAGLIVICLALPGGSAGNLQPFWSGDSIGAMVGPFGVAMVAVLYAYDGWIEITYVGSELRRPERDMPLSILLSTLIVTVLYVGVAFALTYVLGRAGVAQSTTVASDAATVVLGAAGAAIIAGSILISTLGANNGIVFTSARIPYAMAKDGQFFSWAARVHPKYAVPVTSLVVQGIWAALLAMTGTYNQLGTYVVFVGFLFYALAAAAVLLLRRREPELPRPYRTWGYPLTPIIFIAFAGYLIWNTIVEQPLDSAVGAGLLLLGLVPYYALRWRTRKT